MLLGDICLCSTSSCGVAPSLRTTDCPDGTTSSESLGPCTWSNPNDACVWDIIPASCGDAGTDCSIISNCGQIPTLRATACQDGSVVSESLSGCELLAGSCEWVVQPAPPCPLSTCANGRQDTGERGVDCGVACNTPCPCVDSNCGSTPAPPTATTCSDGSTATQPPPVCEWSVQSDACAWQFGPPVCPDDPQPLDCSAPGACGPPPTLVTTNCPDGTTVSQRLGPCELDAASGAFCFWGVIAAPPCPDATAPTCSDGLRNQGESGVDCGGPCPPTQACCADGLLNQDEVGVADCGGICTFQAQACPVCTVAQPTNCRATCADGLRNQGELGIDCGGPCVAVVCPTCSDGEQNQNEQGVDCGGPCLGCAERCANGRQDGDEVNRDCGGISCRSCVAHCFNNATDADEQFFNCGGADCIGCDLRCSDGVKTDDEVGVDCGGSACVSCAARCANAAQDGDEFAVDCGGADCVPCPSCDDGVQNQDEASRDCGGVCGLSSACPACSPTMTTNCLANCQDGLLNQDEIEPDCGGRCGVTASCPPCSPQRTWSCLPSCSDGVRNQGESQVDCGGSFCPQCPTPTTTASPATTTASPTAASTTTTSGPTETPGGDAADESDSVTPARRPVITIEFGPRQANDSRTPEEVGAEFVTRLLEDAGLPRGAVTDVHVSEPDGDGGFTVSVTAQDEATGETLENTLNAHEDDYESDYRVTGHTLRSGDHSSSSSSSGAGTGIGIAVGVLAGLCCCCCLCILVCVCVALVLFAGCGVGKGATTGYTGATELSTTAVPDNPSWSPASHTGYDL